MIDRNSHPDVSIVMPCLDEAATLPAAVQTAQWALQLLREKGLDGEIVVADNGSADSSYARVGSIMSGPLTFIKDGSGAFTLGQTNALSGAVIVSNGVLAVTATGSFGLNAVQVIVAGGTLSLSNNTALCDAAAVTFAENGTGVIDLPADVNVTVDTLWFGEKQRVGGTYGAPGSGA